MALLSREEFNRRFAQRIGELRQARGLSRAEMAEGLKQALENRTPADVEMALRRIAALAAVITSQREKRRWTYDQLAERSGVPVQFIRDLEELKDFNPDTYFLYRVGNGLGFDFPALLRKVWRLAGTELDGDPIHLRPLERFMKKLKLNLDSRERALVYDDLKGKIFSQLRIFQIGRNTSVVLVFEDKTTFHVSLEPMPAVRLSLYGEDDDGDLEEIAMSERIPVPLTE
jgi:transcriptional regulator with XRE-family HTH domain